MRSLRLATASVRAAVPGRRRNGATTGTLRKALSAARPAVAALFLLGLRFVPAVAQAPVAPGDRVRVVIPGNDGDGDRYIVGTLVRLAGDTATLLVNSTGWRPDSLRYALNDSAGRHLERVVGIRRNGGKGALIGALAGGTTLAIVAAATWKPCTGWCLFASTREEDALGGFFVGGVSGAAVGWLIGRAYQTELWGPVTTSGVSVTFRPGSVGLRLAF